MVITPERNEHLTIATAICKLPDGAKVGFAFTIVGPDGNGVCLATFTWEQGAAPTLDVNTQGSPLRVSTR